MARKVDILEMVTTRWRELTEDSTIQRRSPYALGNNPNVITVPGSSVDSLSPSMLIRETWRKFHVYNPNLPEDQHHTVHRSVERAVAALLEA